MVCIILDRLTNYFAQFQPIWELGWWHRPQTRNRLLSRKYPWIYTHAWRWRMWRYSSSTRYFVSLKLMFPPTKHIHTHAHTHSNNKNSNNNNNLVNKESVACFIWTYWRLFRTLRNTLATAGLHPLFEKSNSCVLWLSDFKLLTLVFTSWPTLHHLPLPISGSLIFNLNAIVKRAFQKFILSEELLWFLNIYILSGLWFWFISIYDRIQGFQQAT